MTVNLQKFSEFREASVNFAKANWYKISILLLACFAVYWFGIRPAQVRAHCAWVTYHYDAIPAQPPSSNWPQCETDIANLKRVPAGGSGNALQGFMVPADPQYAAQLTESCKAPKDAIPAYSKRIKEAPLNIRDVSVRLVYKSRYGRDS
jgi:hypothetical protein